jgi:hypothetical protein
MHHRDAWQRLPIKSDLGRGSTYSFTLPVNVERQVGQS